MNVNGTNHFAALKYATLAIAAIAWGSTVSNSAAAAEKIKLFNGKDLTGWKKFVKPGEAADAADKIWNTGTIVGGVDLGDGDNLLDGDGVAAKLGAHVATLPPNVLRQLFKHALTDNGLKAFLDDWAKTGQKIA